VTNLFERPAGAPASRAVPPGAGNDWWYYVLRIKVVNRMITEVEQLIRVADAYWDEAARCLLECPEPALRHR
jgi:hypothetical protein